MGRYRIFLLAVVVFANIIASYEGNLAPIVPMLLEELNITAAIYGQLNVIPIIVTAFVSLFVGVYADRWGRSIIVLMGVFLTAIFIFLLAGITTVQGFLIIKILLGIVDGLAFAPIAGLVRDFSPQMGRGVAYAFWTLGPVGGPFIANFIASWTLPIFGSWQSQLYIMGTICVTFWIVILVCLRDLSPELRSKIYVSEPKEGETAEKHENKVESISQKTGLKGIFSHPVIWIQPIGIVIFLPVYFTMIVYGPLFFTEVYNVSTAEGSKFTMYYWLGTFIGLFLAGWLSDRIGLRKICTLVGALSAIIFLPIWIIWGMGASTNLGLVGVFSLLAGFTGATAYSPWMAMYSENLEAVNPNIQATGWGFYGLVTRLAALLVALLAPVVVETTGSWKSWFMIAEIGMICYLIFPFLAIGQLFPRKVSISPAEKAQ